MRIVSHAVRLHWIAFVINLQDPRSGVSQVHPDRRRTRTTIKRNEQWSPIDILYVDMGGAVRTYDGPESAFDWTDVKESIAFERDGESTALTSKGGKVFGIR